MKATVTVRLDWPCGHGVMQAKPGEDAWALAAKIQKGHDSTCSFCNLGSNAMSDTAESLLREWVAARVHTQEVPVISLQAIGDLQARTERFLGGA